MNQSKINIALQELENYLLINNQVTTLDFKNHLRMMHPDLKWKQADVSLFLSSVDGLGFTDNGTYRTYFVANNPITTLSSKVLEDICTELEATNISITKTILKSKLRNLGYGLDDFKQVFDSMNFVHTGKYTVDNHKIYKLVDDGQHLSQTKGEVMDINTMNKNHIFNTLLKNFKNVTVEELMTTVNYTETYNLLKAYFLWDIRRLLNKM